MPLPAPVFNPRARLSGQTIGHERSPVVIIDEVFANADAVAAFGRSEAVFRPPAKAYPGLTATLDDGVMASWLTAVQPLLTSMFGLAPDTTACAGYFGLVTLKPEDLSPGQSMPHVDHVGHRGLAAVAYLCADDQGGTGFYRHRSTGLERLTAETIGIYNTALNAEADRGPAPGYTVGDHPLFERIGVTEARFNRMVIYNCNLLHSGQVDPAKLSSDPKAGRLTLNLFIG